MGRAYFIDLLWIAALGSACSSGHSDPGTTGGTVASCRTEFAAEKGYGHEDDLRLRTSPPGDAQPPPLPSALDEAVATCIVEGASDCDAPQVLTREAALCIARGLGLPQGIEPWKAGLTFHYRYRRIVWNVQNLLQRSAGGSSNGDVYTIDATTGDLIGRSGWSAIP